MSVDAGLRPLFRKHLPKSFDVVTIESGSVGRGIPDINYCCNGVEGWIEAKKADHWRCVVRPEQIAWAERRLAYGGRVFIAVRRDSCELWLYHGEMTRRLLKERLDAVPCLGRWGGSPARWDWATVAELLTA
jgi:Holliday junction resolvase